MHQAYNIQIVPLTHELLSQVYEIEQLSFSIPWSLDSLEQELNNDLAYYFVAMNENEAVGYIGLWHVVTEGHITNIAVKPEMRRFGIGDLLMKAVIGLAESMDMIGLTLEVRVGNRAAMALYNKHGFIVEGIRKNYYSDTKEDAIIMWKYL